MKEYLVSEKAEGAFRTLGEALAKANRQGPLRNAQEPVRILVEGTLHLTEPLRISGEELSALGCPVLVEGVGDARISGGKELSGFSHWKGKIWRVKVPEAGYTRHLYIDGKPARRPATPFRAPHRWEQMAGEDYCFANLPKEEQGEQEKYIRPGEEQGEQEKYIRPAEGWEEAGFGAREERKEYYTGIATTHRELLGWKNVEDIELVFEVGWVHRIVPIKSVQEMEDGRVYIHPEQASFQAARTLSGVQAGGCPNCLENVFELLGEPLEWYFDRKEQMLYVGFEEGDCPENHTIVFPLVEQLLEVKGELGQKPARLCFRNLTFSHTTWLRPARFGHPEIQANQLGYTEEIPRELLGEKPYENDHRKVVSALRVLAAREVDFEGCSFTALGTGALQYEFGAEDCRIEGNHFYEIGGSAVILGEFYGKRAHHPEDRREIVRDIQVTDNRIHDTGRDFKGSVAVIAGYVQDVTVAHNLIYDVPYSAISMGWGWGSEDVSVGPKRPTPWKEPTVSMRNKILYNHIHHCMQLLCDGGAIYTLGCMAGTAIIGNYIHESAGFSGDGYPGVNISGWKVEEVHDPAADPYFALHGVPGGIYLDEGSIGIEVSGNILHDVAVPLFYHNQIDEGYKRVVFGENTINLRPGQEGFPAGAAGCTGPRPEQEGFFAGVAGCTGPRPGQMERISGRITAGPPVTYR